MEDGANGAEANAEALCVHAKALGEAKVSNAIAAAISVIAQCPRGHCSVCLRCGEHIAGFAGALQHMKQLDESHALSLHVPASQLGNCVAYVWCTQCGFTNATDASSMLVGARSLANTEFGGLQRNTANDTANSPMPLYEPSIRETITFPTDTQPQPPAQPNGIVNLGSSCYLSSVVQALAALPPLRAYFLGGRHQRDHCKRGQGSGKCVACELDSVFQLLSSNAHSHKSETASNPPQQQQEQLDALLYPTGLLYSCFSRAADGALNSGHQDAHELLLTLCKALHDDHTEGAPPPSPRALSMCECPVHSTLGGWSRSDVYCKSCGKVSSSPEPFLCLSLTISAGSKTSLPLLLSHWAQAEQLPQSPCPSCSMSEREKSQVITLAPPVLAVHLMRFGQNVLDGTSTKVETDVLCPLTGLDVREVTANGVAGCSKRLPYDLVAVVNHIGEHIEGGHYVAHVRRGSTGAWDRCDDWNVTQTSERAVREAARSAYLLFYADNRLVEPAGEQGEAPGEDLSQLLEHVLGNTDGNVASGTRALTTQPTQTNNQS